MIKIHNSETRTVSNQSIWKNVNFQENNECVMELCIARHISNPKTKYVKSHIERGISLQTSRVQTRKSIGYTYWYQLATIYLGFYYYYVLYTQDLLTLLYKI